MMDHIDHATHIDDLEHNCNQYLQLCVRLIGKDKKKPSYVRQCLFCGDQKGGPLAQTIPRPHYEFDEALKECFREKYKELIRSRINTEPSSTQSTLPLPYELFDEQLKALQISMQERGLTEAMWNGYLSRYLLRQRERVCEEFKTSFPDEKALQHWLQRELSRWFHVYPEVSGTGFIDRKKQPLKIDFILKAKPALLEKGFTEQAIGIEVKHLNPQTTDGFHGKSSRGIFQALSYWYSGARWHIPNQPETELAAVLIFSNLSFTRQREYLFDSIDKHYQKFWSAYFSIAHHGNVGELLFGGDPENYYKWQMNFTTATYFTGYRNGDLVLGNKNLINKLRIGSTNSRK